VDFSYLLEKISNAKINNFPFRHIQINDLFKPEDFQRIIKSYDVALSPCRSDQNLFDILSQSGYKIIKFPGCTVDKTEYINWHKNKSSVQKTNSACEGFGTVLRLISPKTDILKCLQKFLHSKEFIDCISSKFNIDSENCSYDAGIQKYLDGYEISPHPDVRGKALTYMVNINSDPNSQNNIHHTSYLKFKNEFNYVKEFWEGNEKYDRCWVPWSWCNIIKQQVENNSMVMFSPSSNTMHAVKANYDHLNHQRTQLYGNLWYKKSSGESTPNWERLALSKNIEQEDKNLRYKFINRIKNKMPYKIKKILFKEN